MTVPQLVLYGARQCTLCDAAAAVLSEVAARHDLKWRKLDIDGDPELEAAYRSEIPVLLLDGRKIAKYRIDPVALEAALRARGVGPR